jgi:hypothetical protein
MKNTGHILVMLLIALLGNCTYKAKITTATLLKDMISHDRLAEFPNTEYHSIKLEYKQIGGRRFLEVYIEGPGINRRLVKANELVL